MDFLADLRVIDFSTEISGAYCTKLFCDAGADVVKVESPQGDPLRSRFIGTRRDEEDGALFRFLNAGKRSVIGEVNSADVAVLLAGADLVVESFHPTTLDIHQLAAEDPRLVIVSISPYGRSGPWRDRPATGFIVEAESGALGARGRADQPPIQAGGRLFEWLAGAYAATASLGALTQARTTGHGEVIDLSLLEVANAAGSMFGDLIHQLLGRPPITAPARVMEAPSIEPTADGWVGFNTNTRQQFNDFLVMIERTDLLDDDFWVFGANRIAHLEEWNRIVHPWTQKRTTEEIVELASLFRIPVAEVNNGQTVLENAHFTARNVFRDSAAGAFREPVPPYRFDGERFSPRGKAPLLGEHQDRIEPHARPPVLEPGPRLQALEGLRVVDATAFWAGPSSTHILAALGADVIHVEAIAHLDGARMGVMGMHTLPQWWERAPTFLAANTNKRGLTLDLNDPRGLGLLERLIVESDVIVENFSPRVFEAFGLDRDRLLSLNPRLVIVRMPAFGLDGPWRNNVGFAQTMEQMTGLAWVTGHSDGQPRIVRGPCDPLAGMHSAFAMMLGVWRRQRSGTGVFVEAAMVESALNVAAEQVIEFTAYGNLLERLGNRSTDAAPQGLYRCRGNDEWLALAVQTDDHWHALKAVLGNPSWANLPELSTAVGRHDSHDLIDRELQQHTESRDVMDVVVELVREGVPAGSVRDPRLMSSHPQLNARGYFEEVGHPVVGNISTPAMPFKFASVDRWLRTSAPTVGQHNRAILTELLGVHEAELAELEKCGVIGAHPANL